MSATVIVNGQTVVHKDSGGVLTTGPDVCLTPMGPSVVPIPYTNIAVSADTSQGSTSVAMDSNPIMLKGSVFSKSTGDEPGKVGGVSSGITKGKAKFVNYSSDVFADGKPVCRRLDPMVSNLSAAGNTPPAPLQQGNARARGKQAQGHLLSVALVFEHPDVVTGRTTQPLVDLKYSLNGPKTITVAKSEPYTGIQEYVPQGGYALEFDRNDLKEKLTERSVSEKQSSKGAAFRNHKTS
ncbi:hypothetical protein GeomeDRAFT_2619 [Geobacter metallireducens RCH3]|uniref:Uncharacterized protein n=1 Tax=Geobacter metallireducens (strain ATCC 53774 / DSM 7210 / GS-15) TaxID=269799 RepID=Q39YZ1_GEOMG|nr:MULTISPECIES: DUF4150 domain-containing protein [Geobacter]ABB30533.1 protein of unknown function DUF4150 [Geobacter metallireducens GS-15]EHP85207.1 hypothetical protein GeomeDRAFT_2619 [Geobacter metallireducens RCH3]MBT1076330.1 DUF4150 domain-containing protein [Geobacter grbiciae]